MAADMATKAPPAPAAPPPSPWDVAISAALMTDYNWRGITQSAHEPSTQAGFELRYNQTPSMQWYAGLSGESIDFANNAAAEIDIYGGFRPTFDKLALDFGFWEYWYPGGNCYGFTVVPGPNTASSHCSNPAGAFVASKNGFGVAGAGNEAVADASFWELYGKATYTFSDQWAAGVQEYYSPNVSGTGAWGWFSTGNVTYTAPATWFPANSGIGGYISGDLGYWDLGTSNAFYGTDVLGSPFAFGVKYTSYTTWDAGFGWTYKAFTLDLRYYDTNLTKAECNAFTSASNSSFSTGNITTQNPNGLGSNWCGASYIAKLSFAANLSGLK
jgi:hypothetical protein